MGACHVDLGAAYLGTYPGVGAYYSTGQNSYLGAYPGVGAYAGDYGTRSVERRMQELRISPTSYATMSDSELDSIVHAITSAYQCGENLSCTQAS